MGSQKKSQPLSIISNKILIGGKVYNSSEKLVLVSLMMRADNTTHLAYPGIDTLSEMTGLHRKTVIDTLKQLEQKGAIAKKGNHGAGRHTVYQICIENLGELPIVEEKTGREQYKELVAARGRGKQ